MENEAAWYQIDMASDIYFSAMSSNFKQSQFSLMEALLIRKNQQFLPSLQV